MAALARQLAYGVSCRAIEETSEATQYAVIMELFHSVRRRDHPADFHGILETTCSRIVRIVGSYIAS